MCGAAATHQPISLYRICTQASAAWLFIIRTTKQQKKKKKLQKNGICEKMRIRRKMQAIKAKVVPEIMSDCVRLILSCAFYIL